MKARLPKGCDGSGGAKQRLAATVQGSEASGIIWRSAFKGTQNKRL